MFTNPYEDIYNDILYFKSLYPDSISHIYAKVSDYSDKLEYDKSLMFDEYPDKARIRQIAISILSETDCPNVSDPCCPMAELIEVLLLNEFIHRRIRRHAFQ